MRISEYIYTIKNSIDTQAALERYGISFNNRGFSKCPFHADKTASFKVKGTTCHCFGCGWTGDIVDFLCKRDGITAAEAASKVNYDFGVGLEPIYGLDSYAPSTAQNKAISQAYKDHLAAAERERIKTEAYNSLTGEWIQLDMDERKYAPKSIEDPIDDRFCKAIVRKPIVEYLLMTLV